MIILYKFIYISLIYALYFYSLQFEIIVDLYTYLIFSVRHILRGGIVDYLPILEKNVFKLVELFSDDLQDIRRKV